MTGAEVLDVANDGIYTLLIVSAPLMLVALGVGLLIAFFQALTQIQEMTIVFVPKIIAIFLALIISLPFVGTTMSEFMDRIVSHITEVR